jgi:hypothetical protein
MTNPRDIVPLRAISEDLWSERWRLSVPGYNFSALWSPVSPLTPAHIQESYLGPDIGNPICLCNESKDWKKTTSWPIR